jgi:hypothetical protein
VGVVEKRDVEKKGEVVKGHARLAYIPLCNEKNARSRVPASMGSLKNYFKSSR